MLTLVYAAAIGVGLVWVIRRGDARASRVLSSVQVEGEEVKIRNLVHSIRVPVWEAERFDWATRPGPKAGQWFRHGVLICRHGRSYEVYALFERTGSEVTRLNNLLIDARRRMAPPPSVD